LFVSRNSDKGEVVPASASASVTTASVSSVTTASVTSMTSVGVGGGSALAGEAGNVSAAVVVAAVKIAAPARVLRWWRMGELED